jgi:vacuolar-type H+-ATPase subunit E/Vma4
VALSREEKLKNFASEVTNEARLICEQTENQVKAELEQKTKEGKDEIFARTQDYILSETEKIKKENSLEISKANILARQDYFKYGDEVSSKVFGEVRKKLAAFAASDRYFDYLLQSCRNVTEKTAGIDIYYMPEDEPLIAGLEKRSDFGGAKFIKDDTIKSGGLRFFDRAKNRLINDGFEEKIERAKQLLNLIISPHFTS